MGTKADDANYNGYGSNLRHWQDRVPQRELPIVLASYSGQAFFPEDTASYEVFRRYRTAQDCCP